MKCTVQCLNHCNGVQTQYGIAQGHLCYTNCNHVCQWGCISRGEPDTKAFTQDWTARDYYTASDFKKVDELRDSITMVQRESALIPTVGPLEDTLPTMDM